MSMATPRYYDDPDFQKWYDFETGQFKEGAPQELIEKVKAEEKQYRPIPVLSDFTDENGKDRMAEVVEANYYRIKQEAAQIVEDELRRIAADPKLQHLFKGNETVAN